MSIRQDHVHWAALEERGLLFGIVLLGLAYRLLGRTVCRALMLPVVGYFFITGTTQRRASADYLRRLWQAGGLPRRPGRLDSLRHFWRFADMALDKFAAWTQSGRRRPALVATHGLEAVGAAGALVIVSHLGNAELSRALAPEGMANRINVLVHTRHAVRFNRAVAALNPAAAVNAIEVTEFGIDTAMLLHHKVEQGEWVVIAGDRVPVGEGGRVCRVPFLGAEAGFPQGPFILASLLRCPVHLLFCLREAGGYRLVFEPFASQVVLPRRGREAELRGLIERYARLLERYCLAAPLQWFNFYDFWTDRD